MERETRVLTVARTGGGEVRLIELEHRHFRIDINSKPALSGIDDLTTALAAVRRLSEGATS